MYTIICHTQNTSIDVLKDEILIIEISGGRSGVSALTFLSRHVSSLRDESLFHEMNFCVFVREIVFIISRT